MSWPPNANKETGIPRDGRTTYDSLVKEGVEGCDGRGCEVEHS